MSNTYPLESLGSTGCCNCNSDISEESYEGQAHKQTHFQILKEFVWDQKTSASRRKDFPGCIKPRVLQTCRALEAAAFSSQISTLKDDCSSNRNPLMS